MICVAGWMAILLLAADGIEGWNQLHTLLRRIVACVSAIAALGIAQFTTGFNLATYVVIPGLSRQVAFADLGTRDGLNRPSATTAQPLEFAAVLALALPLAIHQARFAAPGVRFRRWLQVALIGAALPLTISRSAVLGLAVIALMLVPTWPKRDRRRAMAVIVGAVAAMWVAVPTLFPLLYQLFAATGGESSSTSRLDAYSSAAPFIAAHPWLGQGFGTFLAQTYFFVYDQYLTSLIETGVLGLLVLLSMFGLGCYLARTARRSCTDEKTLRPPAVPGGFGGDRGCVVLHLRRPWLRDLLRDDLPAAGVHRSSVAARQDRDPGRGPLSGPGEPTGGARSLHGEVVPGGIRVEFPMLPRRPGSRPHRRERDAVLPGRQASRARQGRRPGRIRRR